MRYTDKILQSKNDTEYAGGQIFKELVAAGTIVDFEGDVRAQGSQVYTLDSYCYTGTTVNATTIRAYILIDTPYPIQASNIRLILCDGLNKSTGKQKLLEVLPEPDGEYPIFGNDWMRKLSWFLKAEAFGNNFYETLISRCKYKKYMDCKYNLRYQEITTPKERLIFLDEFSDLVSYVNNQVMRGSSRYGCQQRSRKYYSELKVLAIKVSQMASHRSTYWGDIGENIPADLNKPETYVAGLVNFTYAMVKANDMTDLEFVMAQFEIILRVNPTPNPPALTVTDCASLSKFIDEFMLAYKKCYTSYGSNIFEELGFYDIN